MAAFLYHRVDLIAQHRGYLTLGLDINRKLGAGHPLATYQLHGRYLHYIVVENVKPRGLGIKDNERLLTVSLGKTADIRRTGREQQIGWKHGPIEQRAHKIAGRRVRFKHMKAP